MSTEETTQPAENEQLDEIERKYLSQDLLDQWTEWKRLAAKRADLLKEWRSTARNLLKHRAGERMFSTTGTSDPQEAAEIVENIEYNEEEARSGREKLIELDEHIRELDRELRRCRGLLVVADQKWDMEKRREFIERQEARLRGERLF